MALRINGESFSVADSHRQRDAKDVAFEVEGREAADLRLTALDEIAPAGRFRLRVDADKLLIQRLAEVIADGDYLWPSAITLMELSKDEVGFKVPIDLTSLGGFTGMLVDTVPLDTPSVVWLGDGYGPSEEPVGWFAFLAVGEDAPVYVPFWRGEN